VPLSSLYYLDVYGYDKYLLLPFVSMIEIGKVNRPVSQLSVFKSFMRGRSLGPVMHGVVKFIVCDFECSMLTLPLLFYMFYQ
jgi:hypothetical protein